MKKNNRLEIIGIVLLLIGFLSFLSQMFFYIEALRNAYGLGDFLLVLGLALIFINYWRKRKAEKAKNKNERV